MYQTGYRGYTTLGKGLPYMGGFCKWYYIAKENITFFPPVNPATQYLSGEPQVSAPWCGPVQVPRGQMGFEETIKRTAIGHYYNVKLSGYYPGDDPASRVNMENMPYHEYVVVGKLRAGGMHLVVGNAVNGLQFDPDYKNTGDDVASTSFTCSMDSLWRAMVLPSFAGVYVLPPGSTPGGSGGGNTGGGGTIDTNNVEVINFTIETVINIPWTADRINRFGIFPSIEVWYNESGIPRLNTNPVITVDAYPPDTTLFTITLNAPGPGRIILK